MGIQLFEQLRDTLGTVEERSRIRRMAESARLVQENSSTRRMLDRVNLHEQMTRTELGPTSNCARHPSSISIRRRDGDGTYSRGKGGFQCAFPSPGKRRNSAGVDTL